MADTPDRIEKQIDIEAPAERVWELIRRPGWWINEGTIEDTPVERRGDVDVVRHPRHGDFPIRTLTLEPPRYAAFRWEREDGDQATLTEFWIDDRDGGGVVLKVVESGFSSLDVSEEERRAMIAGNTEGWEVEVEAARRYVEGA